MTETKGVIPLITRRINKNMNGLRALGAYGNEKYIPPFHAVALRSHGRSLPSQRRTGESLGQSKEVPKWLKQFSVRRLLFLASNSYTNILETNV